MFYIGETQEIVFKREIEEVKRTTTYIQEEKTLLQSKQLELQQVFKQKTTELESKSSNDKDNNRHQRCKQGKERC